MGNRHPSIEPRGWTVRAITTALLFFTVWLPAARAYTFTHTVPLTQSFIDGSTGSGYPPGSVIGIDAGSRRSLSISNLHGTADKPIIIANRGGRVRVGAAFGPSESILVKNCSFIKLRGDGDPAHFYGFDLWGTNNLLSLTDLSTNAEICFFELHHARGFAGILFKTDPCGGYPPGFVQRDTIIHDNYIHDVPGEGIYAGNSFWVKGESCDGQHKIPHDLVGVRIYNNITERCGREGIQLGSATADAEIFNNLVIDSGLANDLDQRGGIQLGEGSAGKIYNNVIINTKVTAIMLLGRGDRFVYNNVIVNPGGSGIFCDNREGTESRGEIAGSRVRIYHNTIVGYGANAYDTRNEIAASEFINNIITPPRTGQLAVRTENGATCRSEFNVSKPLNELGFFNAANNDYRLLPGSPAVDSGTSLNNFVTADIDGNSRPVGSAYDAGAYERGALSLWPIWNHPSAQDATDGSIALTVVGGTEPYTYRWADGVTGRTRTSLGAGTYSVTVSDATGRSVSWGITLIEPDPLIVQAIRTAPVVHGTGSNTVLGSVTLAISGGLPDYAASKPYQVTWGDPGAPVGPTRTNLPVGTYTYTVTDTLGETVTGSVTIRDAGKAIRRINPGGDDIADPNFPSDSLLTWIHDTRSNPDTGSLVSTGQKTTGESKYNGPNPTDAPSFVLGNYRYDEVAVPNMKYEVTVPTAGTYEVVLYFKVKNLAPCVFNVAIEGKTVISNLNLPESYGPDLPVQKSIFATVTDGKVTIEFTPVVGDPIINGIAVYQTSTGTSPTLVYRVNNGGFEEPAEGIPWQADRQVGAISPYLVSVGQLTTGPNLWDSGGSNTTGAPDNIFANYRYDPPNGQEMMWEFPVTSGTYRVDLFFIERDSTVTAAGQRRFDVFLENEPVLQDFDVFAKYGRLKPGPESFITPVTDGKIDLDFFHIQGAKDPMISGIAIWRLE